MEYEWDPWDPSPLTAPDLFQRAIELLRVAFLGFSHMLSTIYYVLVAVSVCWQADRHYFSVSC